MIMSDLLLYHIFYVGISDIACNEFTKRSTSGVPRHVAARSCYCLSVVSLQPGLGDPDSPS